MLPFETAAGMLLTLPVFLPHVRVVPVNVALHCACH